MQSKLQRDKNGERQWLVRVTEPFRGMEETYKNEIDMYTDAEGEKVWEAGDRRTGITCRSSGPYRQSATGRTNSSLLVV
jgi:hypothetical protein